MAVAPPPPGEKRSWPSIEYRRRRRLKYYKVCRRWLEEMGRQHSLIDVGGGGTEVISWGRFRKRTVVDIDDWYSYPDNVLAVTADWMDFPTDPGRPYSVLTCLQVLEHLDHATVRPFVRKLLDAARVAIVSVPYMWDPRQAEDHVHDPISQIWLNRMMGCEPRRVEVLNDRVRRGGLQGRYLRRMICLYRVEDRDG